MTHSPVKHASPLLPPKSSALTALTVHDAPPASPRISDKGTTDDPAEVEVKVVPVAAEASVVVPPEVLVFDVVDPQALNAATADKVRRHRNRCFQLHISPALQVDRRVSPVCRNECQHL